VKLGRFFDSAVRGTVELPLSRLLKQVGVNMLLRHAESMTDRGGKPAPIDAGRGASRDGAKATHRTDLGIRTRANGSDLKIAHVLDGGSAQHAGLSAGDIIVAIDGLRVSESNLEKLVSQRRPGERARMHVFRRDELMQFDVELSAPPRDTCYLTASEDKSLEKARHAWLGTA
jgi:predicted metalloprotease with PDZ domain